MTDKRYNSGVSQILLNEISLLRHQRQKYENILDSIKKILDPVRDSTAEEQTDAINAVLKIIQEAMK